MADDSRTTVDRDESDDTVDRFLAARAARERRLHARMLATYGPAAPAARRARAELRRTLAETGSIDEQIALLRSTDPLPVDRK